MLENLPARSVSLTNCPSKPFPHTTG